MKLISKILLKILLICQLVILISCGQTKYQVHRPAFIHNQHEITEFNGRIYSYKSILKDGTFVEETNHNVGHMTTNKEYLFVEVNNLIYMVDKNYNVKHIFECDSNYNSIVASNNYLYCYLGNAAEPKICIFNLNTKEKSVISCTPNTIYNNCEDMIFTHGNGKVYIVDDKLKVFYDYYSSANKSIYYNNKMINFMHDRYSCKIVVEVENQTSEIDGDFIYFHKVMKCFDNDVYFALVNAYPKEDCLRSSSTCICNLNYTKVYKYNLESKDIDIAYELKQQEFLIDFSNDYVVYYSNGKVYKNDKVIKDVVPIEVGETFEVEGERSYKPGMEVSFSEFAFYNNQLYYLYRN